MIDGLARLGVLGHDRARVGRRARLFATGLLPDPRRTGLALQRHVDLRQRPSFDRHAGACCCSARAEQKRRWLPDLVSGKKLAAFALTEPQAGSDAANVQTTATPSADGSHYVLNGEKRYITNGAIADVLTVMARTPVPGREDTQVTAFLVTPDMPGFRVVEPRMEKLGIRGTATARLAFEGMAVPRENILGPLGKGLKVALTVLDFGRTTFGACCTGMAKTCLRLAAEHARTRVQFGRPLGDFELVQKKLARMAAWTYAMEAMTTVTAGLIDRGLEDYMLETAMLKVYSTEALWTIVNDAFQIYGGPAYFTDQPLERILRDARINLIGEGANEVLTSFIALVGMRDPGEELRAVRDSLLHPWRQRAVLGRFAGGAFARLLRMAPRARAVARAGPARSGRQPLDPPLRPGGRADSDPPPRGDSRSATRPGADRPGGHGTLRLGLRAEPSRRGTAGSHRPQHRRGLVGAGGRHALPRAVGPPHPASSSRRPRPRQRGHHPRRRRGPRRGHPRLCRYGASRTKWRG